MVAYHINELTGRVNICRAGSPERCPLKNADGKSVPHFDDKGEALAFNESRMNDLHKPLASTHKAVRSAFKALTEHENRELTARMVSEYENMDKNLTKEERHSLHYYSRSGAYSINHILRNDITGSSKDLDSESIKRNSLHIGNLDKIFEKYGNSDGSDETIEPRTLYRYLKLDKKVNLKQYLSENFTKGSSYVEDGYMSTTENLSYITGYAKKRKDKQFVILKVETNKGISLQQEEEQVGSLLSFEKERLLPRDMKFEVAETDSVKVGIDESRQKLLEQFGDSHYGMAYGREQVAKPIPAKNFKIISLVEETD